jgi:hypothetical protein
MAPPEGEPPAVAAPQDYSDEPPIDPAALLEPGTVPYDPEPKRENVRGALAAGLVGLVAFEVAAGFIALVAGTSVDDLRAFLQIVFSPSVALAGSATGFYFAGQRS